jgi:hypothetical protein
MTTSAEQQRFVEVLEELGGSAGNVKLHELLGWSEAAYTAVRESLLAEGVIQKGRGRCGSVSLVGSQQFFNKYFLQFSFLSTFTSHDKLDYLLRPS